MYRQVGKKLLTLRGTSRLEGFHRWFNRMVKGSTYSEQLWDAIMRDFIHTWNVHAGKFGACFATSGTCAAAGLAPADFAAVSVHVCSESTMCMIESVAVPLHSC